MNDNGVGMAVLLVAGFAGTFVAVYVVFKVQEIRAWLHRRRLAHCAMCLREFRKGHGGGPSRRTVCSDSCWENAWREFGRKPLRPVTWRVESR